MNEICTYSFISPKYYDKLNLSADSVLRKSVKISNPLGEDTSVMRTTMLPSMLVTLSLNYNNRNADVRLYELAHIYLDNGTEQLPTENETLCFGGYGEGFDFFTLKGVAEALLEKLGIRDYDVEAVTDDPAFHPGRTAEIIFNGKCLGILGEIHPDVLDNFEIGCKAYAAQFDFDLLFEVCDLRRTYKQLPKFPALTRDLACVCQKTMPVLKLERAISSAVGKTLENISLFDVYEGAQIAAGMKSVAFSLRLRAGDRTLTDEEADAAMKRAIKALEGLGVALRA